MIAQSVSLWKPNFKDFPTFIFISSIVAQIKEQFKIKEQFTHSIPNSSLSSPEGNTYLPPGQMRMVLGFCFVLRLRGISLQMLMIWDVHSLSYSTENFSVYAHQSDLQSQSLSGRKLCSTWHPTRMMVGHFHKDLLCTGRWLPTKF